MTDTASSLLIDEYWQSADPRFLEELFRCTSDKKLIHIAERWLKDTRPEARALMERYIDDGCDRPQHRVLVKRLFKHAESAGDDALMGRFLVAFDRFDGRLLVPVDRYDWQTRQVTTELVWRRDRAVDGHATRAPTRPYKLHRGQPRTVSTGTSNGRFSQATRMHLRRRALRYFRRLGYRDPARFHAAVLRLLPLYQDSALSRPDALLNAWGLMHLLYAGSTVLEHRPTGLMLAAGRTLKELSPAPLHPGTWDGAFEALFGLVEKAGARTVRAWAIDMLRQHHAEKLHGMDPARLRSLLTSNQDEVVLFAVELLKTAQGLHLLPVSGWMELLKVENLDALSVIARLVSEHVTPDRLTLAQCVELAGARTAPVADLGWNWVKQKAVAADITALMPLAHAGVADIREQAAQWLTQTLQKDPEARVELVRDLLDARHVEVRRATLNMMQQTPRFEQSTLLWASMGESPYDDVRGQLLRTLAEHEGALAPDALRALWASVLLNVHRGSRNKRAAVSQVVERMARHPSEVEGLLPLLRVALRSVRGAERRHALAEVARLVWKQPRHRAAFSAAIPELTLFAEDAA